MRKKLCIEYIYFTDENTKASVQFSHSVMSNSLQPHELQHARGPGSRPSRPVPSSLPRPEPLIPTLRAGLWPRARPPARLSLRAGPERPGKGGRAARGHLRPSSLRRPSTWDSGPGPSTQELRAPTGALPAGSFGRFPPPGAGLHRCHG